MSNELAIHHFTTDFTGQPERKAWIVYMGNSPSTPIMYDIAQALAYCKQVLVAVHPDIRSQYAAPVWKGDHNEWVVPVLDGHNDWKSTLTTILP